MAHCTTSPRASSERIPLPLDVSACCTMIAEAAVHYDKTGPRAQPMLDSMFNLPRGVKPMKSLNGFIERVYHRLNMTEDSFWSGVVLLIRALYSTNAVPTRGNVYLLTAAAIVVAHRSLATEMPSVKKLAAICGVDDVTMAYLEHALSLAVHHRTEVADWEIDAIVNLVDGDTNPFLPAPEPAVISPLDPATPASAAVTPMFRIDDGSTLEDSQRSNAAFCADPAEIGEAKLPGSFHIMLAAQHNDAKVSSTVVPFRTLELSCCAGSECSDAPGDMARELVRYDSCMAMTSFLNDSNTVWAARRQPGSREASDCGMTASCLSPQSHAEPELPASPLSTRSPERVRPANMQYQPPTALAPRSPPVKVHTYHPPPTPSRGGRAHRASPFMRGQRRPMSSTGVWTPTTPRRAASRSDYDAVSIHDVQRTPELPRARLSDAGNSGSATPRTACGGGPRGVVTLPAVPVTRASPGSITTPRGSRFVRRQMADALVAATSQ